MYVHAECSYEAAQVRTLVFLSSAFFANYNHYLYALKGVLV